eukprot:6200982-Pleurochrysis_carterae.AAC.1
MRINSSEHRPGQLPSLLPAPHPPSLAPPCLRIVAASQVDLWEFCVHMQIMRERTTVADATYEIEQEGASTARFSTLNVYKFATQDATSSILLSFAAFPADHDPSAFGFAFTDRVWFPFSPMQLFLRKPHASPILVCR